MKKLLLIVSAVFMMALTSNAQELGLRGGLMSGNFGALDGVFAFEGSRIHANLSFGSGIGAAAFFDFLYGELGDGPINYYVGLGATTWLGSPFGLGVAAELGLEYRFKEIPIVIGADYRPSFGLIGTTGMGLNSFGVNIRWVFGK